MGRLHWLVRTPDRTVVCRDYVHPSPDEPTVGTVLDVRGGAFDGGPWRVTHWEYMNVVRAVGNWLEVERVTEPPPLPRAPLDVPDSDW